MQFRALSGFVALVAAFQDVAAITTTSAASTSLAKCGENPAVLSTKKITSKNNKEAVITTYACPGISKGDSNLKAPAKRQAFDQCGVACDLECVEFTNPTPIQSDCLELGDLLEEDGGFIVAPSDTITTATFGTCATSFINDSIFEYEYCLVDWGSLAFTLAEDCIPTISGAACVQPTSDWLIEVFG